MKAHLYRNWRDYGLQSADPLGALPLVVYFIGAASVALTAGAAWLAHEVAGVLRAWKGGELATADARARIASSLDRATEAIAEGRITSQDFAAVLEAIRVQAPNLAPTSPAASSGLARYVPVIVVGVVVSLVAGLLLRGMTGGKA